MSSETTIDLSRRGLSPAETVRHMGWGVGTLLVGDEGYGPTVIEITAVGHHSILARAVEQKGKPIRTSESMWVLDAREWTEVAPAPTTENESEDER